MPQYIPEKPCDFKAGKLRQSAQWIDGVITFSVDRDLQSYAVFRALLCAD
jgi:hypothetical protein